MIQFSRVLAAVDFSKPARGAFEYALALSKHRGAELVVVHAVPRNQRFRWHARERLALTAELRHRARQANVEFKDRVQQGDPAEIILLHARSLHPDVIVMGTHQRSGIDRFRVGSVAERVAAKSMAPVLLVPATPGDGHDPAVPPCGCRSRFQHRLKPCGGTGAGERVGRPRHAASCGAWLLLWCAAAPVPLRHRGVPGPADAGCTAAPAPYWQFPTPKR